MTVAGGFRRLLRSNRVLQLLPYLVLASIAALDWSLGEPHPRLTLEPALTAGPALAAVVGHRTWYPLLVGALGVAAAFGLAAHRGALHQSVHSASVLSVVLIALIGAAGVRLRARQEKALADAWLIAEVAQRVLLRSVPERIGPVRAAVHYAAATAHARIGGDLYEVVQTRFGVRAVVGDVRGKGLGAVETAADVLGAFREAVHQEAALDKVAQWLADSLDRSLREHAAEKRDGGSGGGVEEEFVTLVLIGVRDQGVLEVVNCGHPSPLLLRDGVGLPQLLEPQPPEPPLGVLRPEEVRPTVLSLALREGDRILLYTDGVIEARDSAGEFYPLPARLPYLARVGLDGPSAVLARIHDDVRRYVGRPLGDDAAMLLLQYEPVSPPIHPNGALHRTGTA